MSGWDFDKGRKKTEKQASDLSQYYQQKRLNADNFACPHYPACAGSQKPDVENQFKGGTLGLMPCYDTWYNGKEIRVLIIGKQDNVNRERWHKTGVAPNFDIRSKASIDWLRTIELGALNRHIEGTLLTLQEIFKPVKSRYLYASYALGNGLRCAFQHKANAESRSGIRDNTFMHCNCLPYLIEEIKILDPTLIIAQGDWAIDRKCPLRELFSETFGVAKSRWNSDDRKYPQYGLYEFPSFMYITSRNPAWRGPWKAEYAPEDLWPKINYLKKIGYLPHITKEDAAEYARIVKKILAS